uniref:Secreted protein n=1 Tax=Anopheles coluzzii TaxID=1518534 RepID=A0A8W7PYK9_ANOCL
MSMPVTMMMAMAMMMVMVMAMMMMMMVAQQSYYHYCHYCPLLAILVLRQDKANFAFRWQFSETTIVFHKLPKARCCRSERTKNGKSQSPIYNRVELFHQNPKYQ